MIGIFDSGVGGLTVVKELRKQLPDCRFVYLGDTARTPYGNKSQETIIKYSEEDVKFLLAQGAEVIVIACNTASSLALEDLKAKFSVPIFDVVSPAVEKAVSLKIKKIGLIGTSGTVASGVYVKLIKKEDKNIEVYSQACPLFVPLVEEGWLDKPEVKMIARRYLNGLRREQVGALILGCTHYPLLKKIIQEKIGKKTILVDSGQEVIAKLKNYLISHPDICQPNGHTSKFFVTDLTVKFQEIAEKWLGEKVKVEKTELKK
jgi:glutamate racemase